MPDTDFAGRYLVRAFREGKLGRWTLDGLGRGGEAVDVEKELEELEAAGADTGGSGRSSLASVRAVLIDKLPPRTSYLSRDAPLMADKNAAGELDLSTSVSAPEPSSRA